MENTIDETYKTIVCYAKRFEKKTYHNQEINEVFTSTMHFYLTAHILNSYISSIKKWWENKQKQLLLDKIQDKINETTNDQKLTLPCLIYTQSFKIIKGINIPQ